VSEEHIMLGKKGYVVVVVEEHIIVQNQAIVQLRHR